MELIALLSFAAMVLVWIVAPDRPRAQRESTVVATTGSTKVSVTAHA